MICPYCGAYENRAINSHAAAEQARVLDAGKDAQPRAGDLLRLR